MKQFFSFSFLILFLLTACTQSNEKGSKKNPIEISLIPTKEAQSLLLAGSDLQNWLNKETNLYFNVTVPNNYIAVVESFGSGRADVAFLTTNSFAIAYKKYSVEPQFLTLSTDGQDVYKGQFLVHADSKIKSINDIVGKKIAYVDPSSASGYILPAYLLKKKNIKPKEYVFAGKHDSAVTMLYQKQVDVAATFYTPPDNGIINDARRLVKTQFPDVESKIKILDFTQEIPNDAVVFRKDLNNDLKNILHAALFKWSETVEGKKTLKALNNGSGFKKVSLSDYQDTLNILTEMEKELK